MSAAQRPRPVSPTSVSGAVRSLVARALDDVIEPGRADVRAAVAEADPLRSSAEIDAATDELLAVLTGLGHLEEHLADDAVTDVLVNGNGEVWVDRSGDLQPTGQRLGPHDVALIIERIVAPLGLRCDPSSPVVDARLPDGSRLHAIIPPLAVDGPCLAIRRFRARLVEVESFADRDVAGLLRAAVEGRKNVLVSGGTGAGKTTLLNALSSSVAPSERIVTIEEAAELRFRHDHVVRLEARPANAEGIGRITIRDLVRAALRLRPDRIIVGECRAGEAIDMLQAMNTGHPGSMSTVHANTTDDALRRLETMVLLGAADMPLAAVREQLASAIDLLVQVERDRTGRRRVVAVAEVDARSTRPRTRRVA